MRYLRLWIAVLMVSALGFAEAPKAVVLEGVFDAGAIPQGQPVEHDFVIKNEGDATLHILSAKPG